MRAKLPLLRNRNITPARAPVLRYGVAVLSIILALIPAFLLSDVVESRLVVFSVAIMVSAWYGGWKPGLVATSFALTVSAYFSFAGARSPADYRRAIIHLALFVFVAGLICWFNAALRYAQECPAAEWATIEVRGVGPCYEKVLAYLLALDPIRLV